jgi:hypothetical protein
VSNQRQLLFALGSAPVADKLTVLWPSGKSQEFLNLPANREVVLIEGQPGFAEVPRDR